MYKEVPENLFMLTFIAKCSEKGLSQINKNDLERKLYYYVIDDKFINICGDIEYSGSTDAVDLSKSFKYLESKKLLAHISDSVYTIDLSNFKLKELYNRIDDEIKYSMEILVNEYTTRLKFEDDHITIYPMAEGNTFKLCKNILLNSMLITDGTVQDNRTMEEKSGNNKTVFNYLRISDCKYVICKFDIAGITQNIDIYSDTLNVRMLREITGIAKKSNYNGLEELVSVEPKVYRKKLNYIPGFNNMKILEDRKSE